MVDFADDTIVLPHLDGILETLKAVLEQRRLPIPGCFMGIVPGQEVETGAVGLGECDGGMAFARVASIFPSSGFPQPDQRPSQFWVMASVIEVGILREIVVPDGAESRDEQQERDATRLQLADAGAILQAICTYCTEADVPVVMGNYQPFGPAGAVNGGSWTATVGSA